MVQNKNQEPAGGGKKKLFKQVNLKKTLNV